MGLKFQPLLFSGFVDAGSGGSGSTFWADAVANFASLPGTDAVGTVRVTLDTGFAYEWNGSTWQFLGKVSAAAVGSSPNANGFSVSSDNTITLQPADATHPGVLTSGTQTIGGNKTLTGTISASNLSGTNTGDVSLTAVGSSPNANSASLSGQALTLQPADGTNPGILTSGTQTIGGAKTFSSTISASNFSGSSSGTNTGDVTLSAFGSSPNANAASLSGQVITLQPADASNPGGISTSAQTIPGSKTFPAQLNADGGIDRSSSGTLSIGTTVNSSVINIGNTGATVNIQGTTLYENVTQLQVTDPLITLNKGGGVASAQDSGIELEENSVITGYTKTSLDRNSWRLKAPNTAGDALITPGASGITLNQSSHDPITLNAVGSSPNANAASLSSQSLTLQPADGSNPGVITAGTQTIGGNKTFSGTIAASNFSGSSSGTNTGDQTSVSGNAGSATLVATTAVSTNASYFPLFVSSSANSNQAASLDASGITYNPSTNNLSTTTFTGALVGNADTATSFTGPLVGDVTGTQSANIVSFVGTKPASDISTSVDDTQAATSSNTVSTIVKRDGSGNFSAGTITASLTGTASGNLQKITGDIDPTSWSGLANNTANQVITGLVFANANTRSFEAQVSLVITATSNLYANYRITGIQRGSDWIIDESFVGDTVTGIAFDITSAGQVRISIGSIAGFSSGLMKFRATTLAV